jgi:hypothetical protein
MKHRWTVFSCISAHAATLALAASVLVLDACGGGGGGPTTTPPGSANVPSVPTSTGSVTANFVSNGNAPQYFLTYFGGNSAAAGPSTGSVTQNNGAMISVGDYAFSGSPLVVQDIAGDTDFAMGRWVMGTVTKISTSTIQTTLSNGDPMWDWHYLVVNPLSVLPTAGTMTCDSGTFTLPTGGTAGVGTITGSNATLSFTSAGANLSFTLTTTAGGSSLVDSYNATIPTPSSLVAIGGGIGGTSSGGYVALGDGGSGAIRLSGIYNSVFPSYNIYQGVYSFKCQ